MAKYNKGRIEMIVERFTFPIKPGNMDEAVNWLKEGRKNIWPFFKNARIYSPLIGEQDVMAADCDFEDMAEHDKLWQQVFANEEWGKWKAKWDTLRAGGTTHRISLLE
jgi:hypothetical protein